MDRRVELLAPAGNPEAFYGAVHAGADAVYLGGERFGARAYADNFTEEEILACIRYAHIWGCRVYLTVNTLVKEKEFGELPLFLTPLREAGLDGVIVQDIGVFTYIRDHFPGLKLHVSTQMTLTGGCGARLLKEMGADRIVPARELSLSEIKELKDSSGLEVETFVHGAMCYCYSGQCLFSSILGGRSGNRGRCAQPCRLPYRVERDGRALGGECYPLSLKDMCAIERIPELIEAGIDSFKIEGRMKKPEYAAGVTAIYRRYIDRYYADAGGRRSGRANRQDLADLAALYIRSERQDGYFFRQNGRDMVTLDNPSYGGSDEALLARIRERYLDHRPRMTISLCAVFRVGQPARLSLSLERQGGRVQISAFGETVSAAEKQPITKENIARQLGRLGDTSFQAGSVDIRLDEQAFYPLKALNELRRAAVRLLEDALVAENGLAADSASVAENGPVTDSASVVENGLAADVVSISMHGQAAGGHAQGRQLWHLAVKTGEQFAAVSEFPGDRIYLDADLFAEAVRREDAFFFTLCGKCREAGCELLIALPYILRGSDEGWLDRLWESYNRYGELFSGFLVRSMDGLGYLRERNRGGGIGIAEAGAVVWADAGLYIWNRNAMRTWSDLTRKFRRTSGLTHNSVPPQTSGLTHNSGSSGNDSSPCNGFCLPYELNAGEQRALLEGGHIPCEKLVYGRIPLMVTANCVAKTVDGCARGQTGSYTLVDRYRKRFPVARVCEHCMNIIYNSVPLSLHGELSKWREQVSFRMDFTIESGEETAEALRYFMEGAVGKPPYEYTTGHEKRGAE